jgi:hypothetical protein
MVIKKLRFLTFILALGILMPTVGVSTCWGAGDDDGETGNEVKITHDRNNPSVATIEILEPKKDVKSGSGSDNESGGNTIIEEDESYTAVSANKTNIGEENYIGNIVINEENNFEKINDSASNSYNITVKKPTSAPIGDAKEVRTAIHDCIQGGRFGDKKDLVEKTIEKVLKQRILDRYLSDYLNYLKNLTKHKVHNKKSQQTNVDRKKWKKDLLKSLNSEICEINRELKNQNRLEKWPKKFNAHKKDLQKDNRNCNVSFEDFVMGEFCAKKRELKYKFKDDYAKKCIIPKHSLPKHSLCAETGLFLRRISNRLDDYAKKCIIPKHSLCAKTDLFLGRISNRLKENENRIKNKKTKIEENIKNEKPKTYKQLRSIFCLNS